MRERDVERYLVKQIEALGGLCWKWTGRVGVPDRIVVVGGEIIFVEVKQPKGRLSPKQKLSHKQLRERGASVMVVWNHDDVDSLTDDLAGKIFVESWRNKK